MSRRRRNRPSGQRPLKLHPDDLQDRSQILGLVDELLVTDREYWRHTRPIVRAQLRLQEVVSEEAYDQYLVVEDLYNDRANFILEKVVRCVFEQGPKAGR